MSPATRNALSIVVVDSDARFLEKVRNSSLMSEGKWLVRTASSSDEAIRALKEGRTDIIVSALNLPKVNGAELLKQVRSSNPNTLRFLVYGDEDKDLLKDASGVPHRYLRKPLEIADLDLAIRQVKSTHFRIRRKEVFNIVRDTKQLHVNSDSLQELLKTANDPECDIDSIAPMIKQHPTAVATILQVSNTAFYGAGGRIETIEESLQMLGVDFVRNLAITELAKKQLRLAPNLQEIANGVLQHSIETSQCGLMMKQFARDAKMIQTLCSLALLHDLGKLVMLANFGNDYADVLGRSIDSDTPTWKIEQGVYGCDHAAVGGFLFAMWGLPEIIIRSVTWHHEPEMVAESSFCPVSLLHMANYAAHTKNENQYYCGDRLNTNVTDRLDMLPNFVLDLDC